jgi:UDP-N-acetylmuramate dehydrogenase
MLLEPGGAVAYWPVEQFAYAYRSSVLKSGLESVQPQPIVLEAEFSLQPGDRESLETWVADMVAQRKASQPPGASCGSVFKNPPGDYSGRLIEAAGLKGSRVGGAEVSQLHANFILNQGNATAQDVRALIEMARGTVQSRFGIALELEIQLIGEW